MTQERRRINLSRAIAVDMESGTIAAQGYRLRVPYGTLLCVSDKPLHGEIKLPGAANAFYERAVGQHLEIGLAALDLLRERRDTPALAQAAQLRRAAVPVRVSLSSRNSSLSTHSDSAAMGRGEGQPRTATLDCHTLGPVPERSAPVAAPHPNPLPASGERGLRVR